MRENRSYSSEGGEGASPSRPLSAQGNGVPAFAGTSAPTRGAYQCGVSPHRGGPQPRSRR